jgi:hypothetical protein
MTNITRHVASTAIAVALLSGAPVAQSREVAGGQRAEDPGQSGGATRTLEVVRPADAENVRQQMQELLRRHPPSLRQVVVLDPTLLTNDDYLAPYPELAAYLAQHPEVAHHPSFYIGSPAEPAGEWDPRQAAFRMWEDLQQGLLIILVFSTVTGVLVWLIRTLVDHRRWLRLMRVQTETHAKLLDRLTSQEDLLAYMQSPAGRRFLEATPITVDAAARPMGAPFSRVLWSMQAGVVLAVTGLGLLLVSRTAIPEIAPGLSGIGVLTVALGIGFVLSALVAYALSRRMGLLSPRSDARIDLPVIETGLPRGRD